jgi:beta-galactosidase
MRPNPFFLQHLHLQKRKYSLHLFFFILAFTYVTAISAQGSLPARSIAFDEGWRFIRDSISGAESPDYDDSGWHKLDLPHDWSIEDLPGQLPDQIAGPFSRQSAGATATGYAIGGEGWYRKKFVPGKNEINKRVSIHFDGVYMIADVWLNGHLLGTHYYGYTPFNFDLSPWLINGKPNTIAVRVRNPGRNSRWYSGSGIYRHVTLTVTNPLHIAQWGVYITTPGVSRQAAQVKLQTTVDNETGAAALADIRIRILDPQGRPTGKVQTQKLIPMGSGSDILQTLTLSSPQLWSPDSPALYRAIVEVWMNGKIIDRTATGFGIRSIQFDATQGFRLNGRKMVLRGGCLHHDNGPLGSATIDRAEQRKVELMKANGFNAIRTSHNPPSAQFLDACDRLGILVIDEAFDMWQRGKNPDDYHRFFDQNWQQDLGSMIRRDRNHPSVIIWSIGNEIKERADSAGLVITKQLCDETHRLDPSRPTLEAICDFWDKPGRPWDDSAPAYALLDVGGYNYMLHQYEADHQKYPTRIIAGTESFPKQAFENWQASEKYSWVIGDFVWTAMDYMGETAIGHSVLDNEKDGPALEWPWFNAWCGDIDLTGNKKPQSYYRDVVWKRSKIAMAVHTPIPPGRTEKVSAWGWPDEWQSWTWPGAEGKPLEVSVYTRYPVVRLELNGKPIAEKPVPDNARLTVKFTVPYQPGVLKAIGIENGKAMASATFVTAGPAKSIRLKADRQLIKANRNDLSYIIVEIVDDKGNLVPDAGIRLQFQVSGAGELAATGSASPVDMASFQQPARLSFHGRCLVILRPRGKAGNIRLSATADGLRSAVAVIQTK